MTYKEIIKALECCASGKNCEECSLNCKAPTSKDILALINRQQAEIERLEKHNKEVTENCLIVMNRTEERYNTLFEEAKEILINEARAEAIKEFAERLKEGFNALEYRANTTRKTIRIEELREQMDWVLHSVAIEKIDNLVKEMVGEQE